MKKTLYRTYYKNPLSAGDFPDPSIVAVRDKGYYAYATHDAFSPTISNILCSHSWDLTHWSDPVGALVEMPCSERPKAGSRIATKYLPNLYDKTRA